ncbi:MAG: DNA gyrase inhibitor YacG [Blastocatellia bacterium]
MKCPICGKPTEWKDNPDRPFCSERCRVIDLGNWASEDYRVNTPLKDTDDADDKAEQQQ